MGIVCQSNRAVKRPRSPPLFRSGTRERSHRRRRRAGGQCGKLAQRVFQAPVENVDRPATCDRYCRGALVSGAVHVLHRRGTVHGPRSSPRSRRLTLIDIVYPMRVEAIRPPGRHFPRFGRVLLNSQGNPVSSAQPRTYSSNHGSVVRLFRSLSRDRRSRAATYFSLKVGASRQEFQRREGGQRVSWRRGNGHGGRGAELRSPPCASISFAAQAD